MTTGPTTTGPTTTGHPHDHDPDAAFDAAARRAHDAALAQLSPRVRAQLVQRRRAALAESSNAIPLKSSVFKAWPMLALGSTAALALAVGLFALRSADPAGPASPQPALAVEGPDIVPSTPPQVAPAPQTAPATTPSPSPAVATTEDPATATATATETIDVDSLPEDWLAAEFETGDNVVGLDSFEESPDFYLWLGSDESLADATETL